MHLFKPQGLVTLHVGSVIQFHIGQSTKRYKEKHIQVHKLSRRILYGYSLEKILSISMILS